MECKVAELPFVSVGFPVFIIMFLICFWLFCTLKCYQKNRIEMVNLRDLGHLVYLDLSHNSLSSINGLEGCVNIRYINMSNNKITRIGEAVIYKYSGPCILRPPTVLARYKYSFKLKVHGVKIEVTFIINNRSAWYMYLFWMVLKYRYQ